MFSIHLHIGSNLNQNLTLRLQPQEKNNARLRGPPQVQSTHDLRVLARFLSLFCLAFPPLLCLSLPSAPLWCWCAVDLRRLCCKCESFPDQTLLVSIYGRRADLSMIFKYMAQGFWMLGVVVGSSASSLHGGPGLSLRGGLSVRSMHVLLVWREFPSGILTWSKDTPTGMTQKIPVALVYCLSTWSGQVMFRFHNVCRSIPLKCFKFFLR